MKKTLTVLFAAILTACAAVSANAAMFTDFENYAKFEEGDNPVYNLADPADYWDGEWSGGGETADTLTAAITDGVGFNGSKGLSVSSTGTENAGLYLFATEDNKIVTDHTGAAYLRVWCDFSAVDFRKANFGVVDSTFSLFTTDEVDGAWECKFYYSADGATWTEYLHGGDGCFGDAQDSSVLGLKGWFAFPVADFTIRSGANWEAYDALTPANPADVKGVYLFWDYSDADWYPETAFVLDNIELVADYKVFDYALTADAPSAEAADAAPAVAGTPVTDIHSGVTYAEWGTPTIDAIKGDAWANAQSIKIEDISIESAIDEYATAEVSSLWDGENIYFFAEVTDPTIAAQLQDAAWDQDAIGFMIDYAYDRTPEKNYRDLGDAAYAGYVNVPAVEGDAKYPEAPTIFGIKEYADAVESYTTLTSKGYDVEIKMPLSLYKEYVAGDMLGYEICLNNSGFEETYVRDSQTVWKHADGANGENSWQYTANMGTLILNPAPVAEEAPAPVEEAPAPVATEVAEEAPAPVEEAPAPAPEVVEEVVEEAPVEEVVEAAAPVETAPQTFDFGVLAAVAALVSAAGFTLTKKRD